MKHKWLRILATITCTALLATSMPAIATDDAIESPAPTAVAEIIAEAPAEEPAAPTEAPTQEPTAAPEAASTEVPTTAPTVEATEEPAADPSEIPTAAPEATPSPADVRAEEMGISLEALAEMLGVDVTALCAMSAGEIDAALEMLQATEQAKIFTIQSGVLLAYNGEGGDVHIPDGVTAIGEGAFRGCTSLTSVVLPRGVVEIRKSAFEGCASLVRISLCDELRTIAPYAFKDCTALKTVELPDKLEVLGEYAFAGCKKLEKIDLPKELLKLGGVIRSGDQHIFMNCTALKSVTLPEGMTVLGASMFAGCTALEEIHLPSTLTSIEAGAFSGCTALKTLVVPATLRRIATSALSDCPQLQVELTSGTSAEAAFRTAGIPFTYESAPTGITLTAERTTIGVGEKLQLTAQLLPNGAEGDLKFTSSSTRYLTVSSDGVVTAKKAGSATITVTTHNGHKDTLKIIVKKAPTSISLKTSRSVLGVGETAQLTATLSTGTAGDYVFDSSDKAKLTVDESGLVTALQPGAVTVRVKTFNGKTKSGVITVKAAPEVITLSQTALTIGAEDSAKLGYTLNEDAAGAVSFSSSDEAVATVDADGTIHALTQGSAVITATTYNGVSAQCALSVSPAPTAVTLTAARTTIGVGEKIKLNAQMVPGEVSGTLKFSSSNTRYATVSADGVVTGKKTGTVTITVTTYNGKKGTLKITVKKAPTSVSLKTSRSVLGVGETAQLTATLPNGTAGGYVFDSSDVTIATVDENGLVTALQPGTATVRVKTFNGKTKSGVITVKAAPEAITLSQTALTIGAEGSAKLGCTLNGDAAGAVSFSSSDETVATVDADGTIHALTQGSAVITATTYNGVSAECALSVSPAPTGVTLTAARTTIGVGEKIKLNAQMVPGEVSGTLKFSSSNTRYVTVDAGGTITGKKAGSATITVTTYNGKKGTLKITVKKAPTSVSLKTSRSVLGVGETAQLTATLPNGTAGGYVFDSSDVTIATVDENGLVTALQPGTATVSVKTFNGKTKSGVISVKAAPEAITLSQTALTIGAEDSAKLGYTLNEGAAGAVSFSSSDEAVATVDADGTIHALKEGSATITATTYNGVSAECALSVSPAPTAVTLSAVRTTIGIGEKMPLTAQLEPAGVSGTLKFTSSNTRYATVDASGVVTGKKAGSATITVTTYNGKKGTLKITVKKAPTSVNLKASRSVLGVGETAQLTATLPNGTAGGYVFDSSDVTIATVDENGLVTALQPGTATVRVKTFNGKTKSGVITVKAAPEAITLSQTALTIGAEDSARLSYSLNEGAAGAVSFSSSDETVATVDADGTIHALTQGSAVITATTYNGVSAFCEITVLPAPSYIALPYSTLNIGVGDRIQLEPEVDPGCMSSFRYSSSARYATVSADGLVTAKAIGSATITITTYNGWSFKLKVNVKSAPTSLKLTPTEMVLGLGESAQLGYSIPSGSATTLQFLSGDETIASIKESGVVTGLALGETRITASTHNGKTASCAVTVVPAPESIALTCADLMGVGQTMQLTAALVPEGSHTTLRCELLSGDAVTVTADGKVTALKPGSATLRVSTHVDGVYADHTIQVKAAPTSISFDAETYKVNMDETLQLTPILKPDDCYAELRYTIARAGFFTIDESGLVTPIMRGSTSVTVTTHNGLQATVTIQVVDPYFPEEIYFEPTPPSYMELGKTYQPQVVVLPETAIAALVWTSSDPKIVSVDAQTGLMKALSYGNATITASSARNPALTLICKIVVLSPDRCLKMPNRRTTSTASISTTLSQIKNVRASAYAELESLYVRGIISKSDYSKRKEIINRAFSMYLFPWMTKNLELYWKAANSENGLKDYKPGTVYFGMPYTQTYRRYNVDKAVSEGLYSDSKKGYYLMNGEKFADRAYPGNDCSSFVSMAIWGMNSSHSFDNTRTIATTSVYRKLTDTTDLRPGDILNKSASHVVMFLYYANEERTQMVIIEQGGGEIDTNTCSCSIRNVSYYTDKGYKPLRLATLG